MFITRLNNVWCNQHVKGEKNCIITDNYVIFFFLTIQRKKTKAEWNKLFALTVLTSAVTSDMYGKGN